MPEYNLTRLRVLVVDKHQGMRHLVRDILRELGVYNIRLTSTPAEAFEMFKEFNADLILTDWAPDLDGLGFLRMVRNAEGTPNAYAPVVMVSAYTELHHICQARDAGMTEFLAKPFSARLLYNRIKAIVENPRFYVRCMTYFGPDRRRRRQLWAGNERRRPPIEGSRIPAPNLDVQPASQRSR